MMRHQHLEHRFVRNVPRELEPGVLYISMDYATAVHACCCGCGERVVTPFTPTDWAMTFDGESVTLNPSVGNWNQDCRSHYVIKRGRVIECGSWTNAQVEAERSRDKRAKQSYFNKASPPASMDSPSATHANGTERGREPWSRLWGWLSK
ncbi:hypothetical protein HZ992_16455 [Rhizobacter sp. AJA081-3]|uniref:DUF6527 family protein n=1 Tax=Rhizobacter sp. AJA081-3 TaxID=2753607 RepID=UPI001ADEDB7C|nr:DUF6527 family protein [Rhizobacter sp. AJA081-3]QTN21759.1 hypothetical protein HZ992_16455 [Rhizobacter sp. AJA081-3]